MSKSYWLQFGSGNPASFTGLTPTLTTFAANGITAITAPGVTEIPAGTGLYRFIYGPTLPMIFIADGGATLSTSNRYLSGVLDPVDAVDEQATAIGVTLSAVGSTSSAIGVTLSATATVLGNQGSTLVALGVTTTGIGSTLFAMGSTLFGMGATLGGMGATLFGMGSTLGAMGSTLSLVASSMGAVTDSVGSTSVDPTTLFGYLKRGLEFWEGDSIYTKASGVWQLFSRGSSTMLRQKTLSNTSTQATKN